MDTSTIEAAQVVVLPPATAALFENFYRKKSSQITDSVSNLSKGEFPLGVLFFLSCWKFFWIFGSSGPEESGGNSTKKNTPAAGLRHPVLRRIWSTGGYFRSPQDWCRVYPGAIWGGGVSLNCLLIGPIILCCGLDTVLLPGRWPYQLYCYQRSNYPVVGGPEEGWYRRRRCLRSRWALSRSAVFSIAPKLRG